MRLFSVNQPRRFGGAHSREGTPKPQTRTRTQEGAQVPSRSRLFTTLVSKQRSAPPRPGRSALHVGTQRPRRPSPDVSLAPQLDPANGARLKTELSGSRAVDPFPELFNPRDAVKVTLAQGGTAGAREVDLGKACAHKRAAHKSFSVFSPSSNVPSAQSASEACCRRSLYAAQSVAVHGERVQSTRLVHTAAFAGLAPGAARPDVCPRPAARQALGQRRARKASR